MACTLSNTGIQTGATILASQVSQSIDAFTKADAYNITVSGSLIITGSTSFSSSNSSFIIQGISCNTQDHILSYNCNTGNVTFVCCTAAAQPSPVSPYITGSFCAIKPVEGVNTLNASNVCFSTIGGGEKNDLEGNYSVIGGGQSNSISSNAPFAFIGGGCENVSSGDCSIVVGGICNCSTADNSIVIGGDNNKSSGRCTFIGNGINSLANGAFSTIVNGCNLTASADFTFIGGGNNNLIIDDLNLASSIIGGQENTIEVRGSCGAIVGGLQNMICHCQAFILGSCITSSAQCTTHVNNLNIGCTTQMQLRTPIGTGAVGMLTVCDAGAGAAELYFHDGTSYKKVCLVP